MYIMHFPGRGRPGPEAGAPRDGRDGGVGRLLQRGATLDMRQPLGSKVLAYSGCHAPGQRAANNLKSRIAARQRVTVMGLPANF